MAIDQQITCDVCGIAKGETNHWLTGVIVPAPPDMPVERAIAFAPLGVMRPEPDGFRDPEIKHLCGHACAHKLLSQWLESSNPPATERQPA